MGIQDDGGEVTASIGGKTFRARYVRVTEQEEADLAKFGEGFTPTVDPYKTVSGKLIDLTSVGPVTHTWDV